MSHATQYRTDRWTDIGLDLIRLGGVVIRRSGLLRHDNGVGKTALGIRERDTNKQQRNTNKKQRYVTYLAKGVAMFCAFSARRLVQTPVHSLVGSWENVTVFAMSF